MAGKHTVAVVGSGNWGTAIAKIVGENTAQHSDVFNKDVKMWVFEEEVEHEGKKRPLTEVINEKHENVKYLPNIALPEGIVAEPDVVKAVEGANILIFNLPHQFVGKVCKQLRDSGKVSKDAVGISCIKGVEISKDDISLFPYTIGEELGIYVGALSGANIANEVAEEKFCETTIAYAPKDDKGVSSDTIKKLFHRDYFRVGMCEDVAGVSLAGALKNVVAVAAGFADGLGWGDNSKAAVMRVGLMEMKKFAKTFFPDVRSATFTEESCGIADLITSCLGGRNRRCAEAFVKTGKSMDELEQDMLNGQKLQGAGTAEELFHFLDKKGKTDDFKLFTAVYNIVYQGLPPDQLAENI